MKIYTELENIKDNYTGGNAERIEGLYRSPYQIIRMCEFYSASKYLGSQPVVLSNGVYEYNKDGLGRDKPFYNIVNYRVTLAKVATDLDIKDIQITADNPKHRIQAMLLNRESYEWMKDSNFAEVLNKMGSTRPKYGGYLIKKIEKNGELKIEVCDWTKTYTDILDIMGGPIVEIHDMSPVALKKMEGKWQKIDEVLEIYEGLSDGKRNKIQVNEILGEFPRCVLNDSQGIEDEEDDDKVFSLQKYYVADIDGKKVCLFSQEVSGEISDYYEYLSWEDLSKDLGRGVIEDSEEAQVWVNDAVINEKNAMDLAGRVGLKTTSKTLGGNILEHDHGKIYELAQNEDINAFSLAPSALGNYQNLIDKWQKQVDNATSSYNAQTGEQVPSGTPYSQTALLNQVSSRPFDYKREEWGIHLTKIWTNWVIPHLIKKLKKPHTLVSSNFTDEELQLIDESMIAYELNKKAFESAMSDTADPMTIDMQVEQVAKMQTSLRKLGKKRYIEIPEDYFKDIEAKVTVITTGEQKNKAVVLQSLSEILKVIQSSYNPNTGQFAVLENPELSRIFAEIVELSGSGISSASIGVGGIEQQTPQQVPQQLPASTPQA